MIKVVSIELHPDVVDYSMYPGLTVEKLWAGLRGQETALLALGFEYSVCLVDLGETAEANVRSLLASGSFDVVLIGAGIRLPSQYLFLFDHFLKLLLQLHHLH